LRLAPDAGLFRSLQLSPDSVDISPISASNTKFNFNAHRLSNAHVIQGDLLEAISHKFDFIFFQRPFLQRAAKRLAGESGH
jgi:methylase of polypeptide subunit release factors